MPRYTKALATVALLGITAATIVAYGSRPTSPPPPNSPRPPRTTSAARAPSAPPARRSPREARPDAPTRTAIAYALAARNWTATRYRSSWHEQVRLTAGRYRRALLVARPGAPELRALVADRATSHARVLDVREQRRGVRATVVVALQESTTADGQTVVGMTMNEVRLRRGPQGWRVVAWTIVPRRDGGQLRIR